jgi:sugar phosphate isomerase/epimerase
MDFTGCRITRRTLLAGTAAAAASLVFDNAPSFAFPQGEGAYAPFRVGLQSYSLRHFPLDEALRITNEDLSLRLWEAYPEHLPITDDASTIQEYKRKLAAHSVRVVAYGVLDFSADEADARRKLAFARSMGIPTISAHPSPDSLDLLDKLTAEYNVRIAIRNHGPGDNLYGSFKKVEAAVSGHSPRIGACVDTGHYLRSGESPLTAVTELGSRVLDIHLKNVNVDPDHPNDEKIFTPIGTTGGLLDCVAIFRTLKHTGYKHLIALEEEENESDPVPSIKKSLESVARFAETVRTTALGGGQ